MKNTCVYIYIIIKPVLQKHKGHTIFIKSALFAGACQRFHKASASHAVDGRNPAPVDMENYPLFTGLYTFQVVQNFFHQQ